MKQGLYTIAENAYLTDSVLRLRLKGDVSAFTAPGQFVNIRLDGNFLRRPISVSDWDGESFTLLYKVVGAGTKQLSEMQPGQALDILTGLGNGFGLSDAGEAPLLIGGGIGAAPLYRLAKELVQLGKPVTVILGFNMADEVFYEEEFRALGAKVLVTTADGSYGIKGFVTAALPELSYSYYYACGPEPMLKAVFRAANASGQLSFEERMGCGFGACMGCTCRTVTGWKRICREGPVLRKEEILWDV